MKQTLLLPSRFKTIGWFILIPATIAGIILISTGFEGEWLNTTVFAIFNDDFFMNNQQIAKSQNFTFITTDITNTLVGILFIIGGLMVGFSKEKREDEFIANLRLSSLLWSVWVNYALLLFAFLFIWNLAFLNVMVYNMFTILIIFIIRFNYILYRSSKSMADDK
ncbi:MAG: hypothetical protein IPL92_15225 [Saprospiraceae bacterium]|nr:hypothetical protein [Candidatus Opimibacter iunctus]